MQIITQREMLQEMLKGTFSIEWVTCNLKNGTGGEKIFLEQAVFVGGPSKKDKKRNAKHFENYTRNIRAFTGDRIMTVHVDLITKFNGKYISL
jgi:hypothetical protein